MDKAHILTAPSQIACLVLLGVLSRVCGFAMYMCCDSRDWRVSDRSTVLVTLIQVLLLQAFPLGSTSSDLHRKLSYWFQWKPRGNIKCTWKCHVRPHQTRRGYIGITLLFCTLQFTHELQYAQVPRNTHYSSMIGLTVDHGFLFVIGTRYSAHRRPVTVTCLCRLRPLPSYRRSAIHPGDQNNLGRPWHNPRTSARSEWRRLLLLSDTPIEGSTDG
jgi:hypothetical protein